MITLLWFLHDKINWLTFWLSLIEIYYPIIGKPWTMFSFHPETKGMSAWSVPYLFADRLGVLLQTGLTDTLTMWISKTPQLSELFRIYVEKHLNDSSDAETIRGKWKTLRDEEVLGFKKRKYQNWFDEHQGEIDQLISQTREGRVTFENLSAVQKKNIYHEARKNSQRRLRAI